MPFAGYSNNCPYEGELSRISEMDAAKTARMRVMARAIACFDTDYYQTCKNLKREGWVQLGSGNYGSAWEPREGGDYVVKVCGRVDGDSYPAWAVYCEANPMPGLPETEFCTFNSVREQFMCMMPRYKEATTDCHAGGKFAAIYDELYGIIECNWMNGNTKWDAERNAYVAHVPSSRPEVPAAIQAREFFGHLVDWDFHRGNAMWDDRKGLLIITDPIHQGNNEVLIHKVRTGYEDLGDKAAQLVKQDRLALEGGRMLRDIIEPGLHRGEVQMVEAGQAQVKLDGGRGFRFELPKIRALKEDFRHRRFHMPTQLRGADFAMLEERCLQQMPNIQQLPKGWVAKQEGDVQAAARWVEQHGLKRDEVRELIPHMKECLVKFHGKDEFRICKPMAPLAVAFNKDMANMPVSLRIREWVVPMPVARALVHQANKEHRMACQFGANPDRFMWPPAGMRI